MSSLTKTIEAFCNFFLTAPVLLRRVRRWQPYYELREDERETVETHLLSTVWLGAAMLAIEKRDSKHTLNDARILLACALHDLPEMKTGDVNWNLKQDARLRVPLCAIEQEFVQGLLGTFPGVVHQAFRDAMAVEGEDSVEGRFFNAIERIGYMIVAVSHVRHGKMSFINGVFRHQHTPLLKLGEEFRSVSVFYGPYCAYVADMLARTPPA